MNGQLTYIEQNIDLIEFENDFPNKNILIMNAILECLDDKNILIRKQILDFMQDYLRIDNINLTYENKLQLI